jgi:hypothetical protein
VKSMDWPLGINGGNLREGNAVRESMDGNVDGDDTSVGDSFNGNGASTDRLSSGNGNNPKGRRGVPKCTNCRQAKRLVLRCRKFGSNTSVTSNRGARPVLVAKNTGLIVEDDFFQRSTKLPERRPLREH